MSFSFDYDLVPPRPRPPLAPNVTEIYGIPYAPVPAPYIAEGGYAYPGGRATSNPWDTWDFNASTNLATVTDMTPSVQAAVNALAATGFGGTVVLGPGVWRINGVTVLSGVSIQGTVWEEYQSGVSSSPQLRGKRGTYILTDNPAASAFTVAAGASNVTISNLAFIQPQPAEGSGWTPTAFAPSITITGGSAANGAVTLQHLLFWGVYQAVAVTGGTTAGRVTMRDIEMVTFNGLNSGGGIQVGQCADLVLDNVNFFTQLIGLNSNMLSYIANNATAISVGTATGATIANCSIFGASLGIGFIGSYPQQGKPSGARIKIFGCTFETCGTAVYENGNYVSFSLSDCSIVGYPSSPLSPSAAFFLRGTNLTADISSVIATYFNTNVVQLGPLVGSGSGDVCFGVNCWFDNWNQNSGTVAAFQVSSGYMAKIATYARFTNGNGGAQTAGSGTITRF